MATRKTSSPRNTVSGTMLTIQSASNLVMPSDLTADEKAAYISLAEGLPAQIRSRPPVVLLLSEAARDFVVIQKQRAEIRIDGDVITCNGQTYLHPRHKVLDAASKRFTAAMSKLLLTPSGSDPKHIAQNQADHESGFRSGSLAISATEIQTGQSPDWAKLAKGLK